MISWKGSMGMNDGKDHIDFLYLENLLLKIYIYQLNIFVCNC